MTIKVLIAHAEGEEDQAELLAKPLAAAGYEPVHYGSILVGESFTEEASKILSSNGPVVLCGTVEALGTGFCHRLVNAARNSHHVRVFLVRMAPKVYLEALSLDSKIADWQNPEQAKQDLLAALNRYFPLDADARKSIQKHDLESRYRELALKACDIVDLANLPEDDRHLATQELELRRLYVALRMRLEIRAGDDVDEKSLEALEQRRAMAWGFGRRGEPTEDNLVSLGERLAGARRLVVLGDPGAGKSTLLRWLATAFLLKLKNDPDFAELPDIASLPDVDWLPILIRCRDLPHDAHTLDDMLAHSLRKSELAEADCTAIRELLRGKLKDGGALLLVDGLDEITEPSARVRFSQQLEQIHRAHPDAPMVVTSRIVGYREMGYRLRAGFEHLTVADLSKQDKDDFARRWSRLTERAERRELATAELIRDIHSNDRIERLTGNPMLLTTMALIKRKIGRLPQRRVDLYEEAVKLLLNWRNEVDTPLDAREALPQLEYLAHAMCADGIQQLREDEALALLRQVREEYPHIHPLFQHSPEEFLSLLERRTGLLIQSGHTRHNGLSVPVYEFRHLTLQEYLAAIALVQGHYRGRIKDQSLAEAIAPLAGLVEEYIFNEFGGRDTAVVANWREAIRLCLSVCNHDDVDSALLAVLRPLPEESDTERPRAAMAGLCLADEPNVSETVAREVLQTLAEQTQERDGIVFIATSINSTAMELTNSHWMENLSEYLLDEFFQRDSENREAPGLLYGIMKTRHLPSENIEFKAWIERITARLEVSTEREAAAIAFISAVLSQFFRPWDKHKMADGLIRCLSSSAPISHAAVMAMSYMNNHYLELMAWHPEPRQLERLLVAAINPDCDNETMYYLCEIFKAERTCQALPSLLSQLPSSPTRTRQVIVEALGSIGDPHATEALLERVHDAGEDRKVIHAAIIALGKIGNEQGLAALSSFLRKADVYLRREILGELAESCQDEIDRKLLSKYFVIEGSWLDPLSPITPAHIARAAERLGKPPAEIRQRYESLAQRFGLKLA